jgi:KDO2-lipid IV(A) lauroyltransferase
MHHLLAWLSRRPLWFLHAIGAALGWITWAASPSYRRRFAENSAGAGISARAARPAIAAAGRMVLELPFLWLRPHESRLGNLVRMEGEELIAAAHERGRGIVILTPHLGCFEVTAQAYAERHAAAHGPITVLYRPARKAVLRAVVADSRHRPGLAAAPANFAGVRQMMRALRRGEAVGLLPDQVPPEGLGVWAPFFGRPAYTMTLAARLVQQTGATLLLAWGERLPHGRGYVVCVSAPAEALPPDADDGGLASAAAVNRAMEALIRQRPDQYLWGYNRYKTPRAEADTRG